LASTATLVILQPKERLRMNQQTLSAFIWSVADLLRGALQVTDKQATTPARHGPTPGVYPGPRQKIA